MASDRRYGSFLPPGQARVHHSDTEAQRACRWLKDLLAKGSLFQKDIVNQSEAAGIPHTLLYNAKRQLRVIATNVNNRNPHADWKLWFWDLPPRGPSLLLDKSRPSLDKKKRQRADDDDEVDGPPPWDE